MHKVTLCLGRHVKDFREDAQLCVITFGRRPDLPVTVVSRRPSGAVCITHTHKYRNEPGQNDYHGGQNDL